MGKKLIKANKKSVFIFTTVVIVLDVFSTTLSYAETKTDPIVSEGFYNPFKRIKHGPPLKNVTYKVDSAWLFNWIKNPKDYNTNVRMPYLMLEDDEVKAVMAYLTSIADKNPPYPKTQWDVFLLKLEDELTDEERGRVNKLISAGRNVWEEANCGLCHAQKGIGGQVKIVPDLGRVRLKINNRDWLYYWLKNPRDYFLNTMMAQFELADEELKSLIEYILRSGDFVPEGEEEEGKIEVTYSKDPTIVEKGKRVITISRCVICHDIEGIKEILPVVKREPAPAEGFAKVVYERRCLTCHNVKGEGGTFAPSWNPEENKLKEGACPISF